MNKKQEILDCIKTLNLTQEQANRLADVLAIGGEGDSNKSVKFFTEYQDDLITFKVNDKEIPFTEGNEGDAGKVYLINEQDLNYIENNIKGCDKLQMEQLRNGRSDNGIFGIKVLYMVIGDGLKHYIIEGADPDGGTSTIFILTKYMDKYYFKVSS